MTNLYSESDVRQLINGIYDVLKDVTISDKTRDKLIETLDNFYYNSGQLTPLSVFTKELEDAGYKELLDWGRDQLEKAKVSQEVEYRTKIKQTIQDDKQFMEEE